MSTKWTKGPWKVDGFHGRKEVIVSANDRGVCIAVMPHWEPEFEGEKNANADILSAATELYEALDEFVNDIECYCADNVAANKICPRHKAEAALKKARGEQPS